MFLVNEEQIMTSKVQAGLSLLEKELSQLNTAVRNIENNGGNTSLLDESLINKITDNLSNLQLPCEINKLYYLLQLTFSKNPKCSN